MLQKAFMSSDPSDWPRRCLIRETRLRFGGGEASRRITDQTESEGFVATARVEGVGVAVGHNGVVGEAIPATTPEPTAGGICIVNIPAPLPCVSAHIVYP